MSLTDDEVDLMRHGLRLMTARKQLAAEIFYERLFEIDPKLRSLFSDDIVAQTEKVMIALGAVVAQIHDLDACRSMTEELAIRHVSYGVAAEDYRSVGEAVIVTLSEVLEEDFTSDMEAAWRAGYAAIAGAMVEAAYGKTSLSAA